MKEITYKEIKVVAGGCECKCLNANPGKIPSVITRNIGSKKDERECRAACGRIQNNIEAICD